MTSSTKTFSILRFSLLVIAVMISIESFSQLSLDAEVDMIAGIPYNKVRIPSNGGTDFDLSKDLEVQTQFTYRLRASYLIKNRHVVSILYAPLTIRSKGIPEMDLVYSGQTFSANENIKAVYKFNSYRLTYRYLIVASDKLKFGLGLTGKVRDANITLLQEGKQADFPDLGFVPLINFYVDLNVFNKLNLLFEGDALASKQGRAEDIFMGLSYAVTKSVAAKAGVRVLEGGADVERNYNFTWVNYISAGVIVNCGRSEK